MLSVNEAQRIVLEHARPLGPQIAPLSSETLGLVLAEDVVSDMDMPPHDKAMMDGYAVRAADLGSGSATLHVTEEITAGRTPTKSVGPGQAARIMTGAPVPEGADAVVMVERTRADGDSVTVEDRPRPGQNILPRAQEMQAGRVVLPAGSRLRPQEFGLLAAVGRTSAKVHPAPTVAVLSTGDELVEPFTKPGPGQIRNSNGAMLVAQARRAGGIPKFLGIAPDQRDRLRAMIGEGLTAQVLVLSGGVSAGKLDLVPGVLEELGVEAHFHKVAMKPGKPVYFGSRGPTLVFGLPGNPVSSLVCFELFVRPAVRRLQNQPDPLPPPLRATLAEGFRYQTDRPTYHPVRLRRDGGGYVATVVPWFGSPDLRGLTGADAFAVIPAGDHDLPAGQAVEILPVEFF